MRSGFTDVSFRVVNPNEALDTESTPTRLSAQPHFALGRLDAEKRASPR